MLRRFRYDRGDTLARVIARLSRGPMPGSSSSLWTDAIYGWDNEKWSADESYLAEAVRSAARASGPILECGSGLTTLLMGAITARTGTPIHALEGNAGWHERASRAAAKRGMANVTVHLAPMRDFGDFEWYDAPVATLPHDFALIICDGPPASTRGGRSGMLPVMRGNLAPACTVLIDDTNRPAEQELVQRWIRELGASSESRLSGRGFARIERRRS
ncbi:MAG: hypothetical protein ACREMU_00190 [Gemmatimonadaceae bacterium]